MSTSPRMRLTASSSVMPAHRLAVQADDQVAGLDAGMVGRRILYRRNDAYETIFHAHFDAEADEFSLDRLMQFLANAFLSR